MPRYFLIFLSLLLSTVIVVLSSCVSQVRKEAENSKSKTPTSTYTPTLSPSPEITKSPLKPLLQPSSKTDNSSFIYVGSNEYDLIGSGVIFFSKKDPISKKMIYYVLTASHVIDKNSLKNHHVSTSNGNKYSLELIKKSEKPDIAVITFKSNENLIPVKLNKCFYKAQKVFLHSFWSCSKGDSDMIVELLKIEGEIKNIKTVKGSEIIEYDNKTIAGMSGSPLMNSKGLLLAIHFGSEQAREKGVLDVCSLNNKNNSAKDQELFYVNQGTSAKSISDFLKTIDEIKGEMDKIFDQSECKDNPLTSYTKTTKTPCPIFYNTDTQNCEP